MVRGHIPDPVGYLSLKGSLARGSKASFCKRSCTPVSSGTCLVSWVLDFKCIRHSSSHISDPKVFPKWKAFENGKLFREIGNIEMRWRKKSYRVFDDMHSWAVHCHFIACSEMQRCCCNPSFMMVSAALLRFFFKNLQTQILWPSAVRKKLFLSYFNNNKFWLPTKFITYWQ